MSEPLAPPETPAPSTPPAEPEGKQSPERLPDDHPLVTALAAQKAKNADLQRQIDEAKAKGIDPKPEPKNGGDDPALMDRLAAMEKQLADEQAAREAAEANADVAAISAATGVPVALIHGSTHEERQASADAAVAWRGSKTGPTPNPQQGQAPGNTGGSLASGRDRYKASRS